MKRTKRTELRRLPRRGSHNADTINAILDSGFLAHVGFCVDRQPYVIPTLYGRDGEKLYLHGSAASRLLGRLETGILSCITVTLVDGVVLARSAFHHSMNYRSVVAFGTAHKIDEPAQKTRALRVISEHLIAGRWDDVRSPTEKELKATSVLEFSIEEASAKIRTGPPIDDEEDYGLSVWAGILPLTLEAKPPVRDSGLTDGIKLPDYLLRSRHHKASTKELSAEKDLAKSATERTTIMSTTTTNTIRLHRVLRATPERIYRAFLDADAMAKWLPPNGFTGKVHQMDAKVGGTYKMSFTNFTTGKSHSFGGTYVELKPNERIRYTDKFDDPNMPGEMQTTITLKKVSCGTELNVVQEGVPGVIPAEACYLGWQESLTLLTKLVEAEIPDQP